MKFLIIFSILCLFLTTDDANAWKTRKKKNKAVVAEYFQLLPLFSEPGVSPESSYGFGFTYEPNHKHILWTAGMKYVNIYGKGNDMVIDLQGYMINLGLKFIKGIYEKTHFFTYGKIGAGFYECVGTRLDIPPTQPDSKFIDDSSIQHFIEVGIGFSISLSKRIKLEPTLAAFHAKDVKFSFQFGLGTKYLF